MPLFIPGLRLSELFYREAVKPLLDAHFPNLAHSACRIGGGSEVLGFDTEMSRDHDWGPAVDLFLNDEDAVAYKAAIHDLLAQHLPREFHGYSTHFGDTIEPDGRVTGQLAAAPQDVPIKHRVRIGTIKGFFNAYLNWTLGDLSAADWLTFPAQHLRTIAQGGVFHDDLGLAALRQRLAWYPHDVWLYLLAAGWARIGEEEHLMPRAGFVGDELGASIMGSRLIRDVMRLCFLMERQYAPYPKWYGTAFKQLSCADELLPILWRAQLAETWQARMAELNAAFSILAGMHNALNITPPLPVEPSQFFGRPFLVIWGGLFADAILAQIVDPDVKRIAEKTRVGAIDQFIDSTAGLDPALRMALKTVYD